MTTSTPATRVAEYLLQHELATELNDTIASIHGNQSDVTSLTAADLDDILAELDELRASQEYLRSYTEDHIQEQGIRILDHDLSTAIGLKGGNPVEFHTAHGFLRVWQTDDAEGLEISTPGGPRENSLRIIPKSTRAVVVQGQR